MSYKNFTEGFQKKLEEEGEEFLLDLLGGLYTEDQTLNGERFAFRRMRDTLLSRDKNIVRTEFLCFPPEAPKKKLEQGGFLFIDSTVENPFEQKVIFSDPRNVHYVRPSKDEIYYGVVANKAREGLDRTGHNTFLTHDVLITTPEKETYLLDEFDFHRYPLFMLGLVSGEFEIGVQKKA